MGTKEKLNKLEYKGYYGSIEYSQEDDCLFGKVLGMPDNLISYEGNTAAELFTDFKEAIDTYLVYCQRNGIKPRKGYIGCYSCYMMKTKVIFKLTAILLTILLFACNKVERETIVLMTVDAETFWSSRISPVRGVLREYIRVKEVVSGDIYNMDFSEIAGFKYEKGFEYLIKVKKTKIENPPMDASSIAFSLIEVISKTKVGDSGNVVLLTVSADLEWGHHYAELSRPSPLFFLIKEVGVDEWERYPFLISNFISADYELGFEYLIKVKKFPVEPPYQYDELNFSLNHSYCFIEVISKTEKQ